MLLVTTQRDAMRCRCGCHGCTSLHSCENVTVNPPHHDPGFGTAHDSSHPYGYQRLVEKRFGSLGASRSEYRCTEEWPSTASFSPLLQVRPCVTVFSCGVKFSATKNPDSITRRRVGSLRRSRTSSVSRVPHRFSLCVLEVFCACRHHSCETYRSNLVNAVPPYSPCGTG